MIIKNRLTILGKRIFSKLKTDCPIDEKMEWTEEYIKILIFKMEKT